MNKSILVLLTIFSVIGLGASASQNKQTTAEVGSTIASNQKIQQSWDEMTRLNDYILEQKRIKFEEEQTIRDEELRQEKIAAEKKAEEERIAKEKAEEEEKIRLEEERLAEEKRIEEERAKKTFVMESTAYSSDPRDSLGGGTITATGQNLLENPMAVAVDPNVIPLGTRLHVEGYGEAYAVDTGGAIKGNIVDVHFPTYEQCIQWGRRQVTVTILD